MAPLAVRTNCFAVNSAPTQTFYHYDGFSPEVHKPDQRRQLIHRLQTVVSPRAFNPTGPYDGTYNLFMLNPILGPHEFQVPSRDDPLPSGKTKTWAVTLTKVATIHPNEIQEIILGKQGHSPLTLTALTLLNILIRHAPSIRYTSNARSFFPGEERKQLGSGLEVWRGYFQSVRISRNRLLVNVDITAAVVYQKGKLLDLVVEFLGVRDVAELTRLTARDFAKVTKFLKNLKVRIKYSAKQSGKTLYIRELIKEGAAYKFELDTVGTTKTVAEYFAETYGIRILFPRVPAVRVGRTAVIPMELCEVEPGQLYKQAIPANLTKGMVEFSKGKPEQRLNDILQSSRLLDYDNSPVIRQSGMTINTTPITVNGKLLQAPRLLFGKDRGGADGTRDPRDGAWNLLGQTFRRPAKVRSYAVVIFAPRNPRVEQDCQKAAQGLAGACQALGITFPKGIPPFTYANGNADIPKVIGDIGDRAHQAFGSPPNLYLIILPAVAENIRIKVKQFGDIEKGVATQCMRIDKLARANDQYFKNVALKVNVKLGGINSVARGPGIGWIGEKPTMILGADVSHPSPGSIFPSVSALVSSVNHEANIYVSSTYPQPSRMERIADLGLMMKNALEMFNSYNSGKFWPFRLLFYRDGLSEGEFEEVAKGEVQMIKDAINELWLERGITQAKPDITFVLAIKRHRVRFFPFPGAQGRSDRTGNVPAGFVADDDVTGPDMNRDWFLQSHGGLLGTSRPTHYTTIVDELGLGPEHLEMVTYDLCHHFARATRSVSVVAPVLYAHLVCARAKIHSGERDFSDTSTNGGTVDKDVLLREVRAAWKVVNPTTAKTMYFC